jgi:hypothetical protein
LGNKATVSDGDIPGRRLINQRIAGNRFAKPGDVVAWMGALQAQDYAQAVWAIGLRTQSATLADVERAIAAGTILRTWPMRGTIHFVPAEDARWMLELSAKRVIAGAKRRREQLELDEAMLERCCEICAKALAGGKRLTRPEMLRLVEDAGISTRDQRGYHILWYAAQTGLTCIGPMQGAQQTFALLDEWAPNARKLSREEGLAELAGRYFTSRGPATIQDFAWWTGLTIGDARIGVQANDHLRSELIDGKDYWGPANPVDGKSQPASGVYLLPGFDEYLLGYKDRGAVLAPERAQQVVPGGNGVFFPTVVANGQVVGTWKRRRTKDSLTLTVRAFADPEQVAKGLAEAADRYAAFMGVPSVTLETESGA